MNTIIAAIRDLPITTVLLGRWNVAMEQSYWSPFEMNAAKLGLQTALPRHLLTGTSAKTHRGRI